jgi:hypothetical protein
MRIGGIHHGKYLAALPLLFLPSPAAAHVFWIEPSTYLARPADRVELTLRVGEEYVGDSISYIPDWFIRFSRFHDGTEKAVNGNLGDDPAGHITIDSPGAYLVLYENKPDFVELEPAKFERYLLDNGLEHVIETRSELGESDKPAGEYYSRCARAIITTDGDLVESGSVRTGCMLDLVLEGVRAGADGETRFRLLFDGEPVGNVLVTGIAKADPGEKLTARTGSDGIVRFPALSRGTWLFSGVHIIREEKANAQWRSYWASMTFQVE